MASRANSSAAFVFLPSDGWASACSASAHCTGRPASATGWAAVKILESTLIASLDPNRGRPARRFLAGDTDFAPRFAEPTTARHANHAQDFNAFVSCLRLEGRYVAAHSGVLPLSGVIKSRVPRH